MAKDSHCWDQYWQSGRGTCCGEPTESENAALVATHWRRFFADLRDRTRVLDLCTGNGAVPRLAIESAARDDVRVDVCGIDFAITLPPADTVDGPRSPIWFVRGAAQQLPFADASFDVLTSQFGIEYTPVADVAGEVMRVARPGARAMFIVHAADGVTVRAAKAELDDIDELLAGIGIFPAAIDALTQVKQVEESAVRTADNIAAALRAKEAFESLLRSLAQSWQRRAAASVFRDTGSLLQHTYRNRAAFPLDALLNKVRETEQAVRLHRERLLELTDAALDEVGCRRIAGALHEHGASRCDVQSLAAANDRDRLAWVITACVE